MENSENKEIETNNVQETLSEVSNEDVTNQENPSEVVSESVEQPATTPVENSTNETKPQKKKGKGGLVVLVLLLFVALLVAIFVPSFLNKEGQPQTIETDANEVKSAYRLSGNGLEDFDLYFLQLENKEVNKVYSPLSIKYVLAMLNEGTAGTSHAQIKGVIGDYKAKKYNNNDHMGFANAMYIKDIYKNAIKEEYTKQLKEKYGAEVTVDPFTSPDPINNWISDKTFHLITNMLTEPINEYDFFLVNALAIDMNWVNQLQCEQTESRSQGKVSCKDYSVKYIHENYSDYVRELMSNDEYDEIDFNGGKVKSLAIGASINNYDIIKDLGEENIRKTVGEKLQEYIDAGGEMCGNTYDEYMDNYIKTLGENYKQVDYSTDFSLYDGSDVKAFAKDLQTYDGVTLQYVAIMPKEASLESYIKELDVKSVNNVIKELKDIKLENFKEGVVTKIKGHIPVFNYDYELDLMNDLKKLGIKDVFSAEDANLSNMIKTKGGEFIAKADHKAVIEFSNDGIKAAAVTLGGGKGAAGCPIFDYEYDVPVETIDITFDKPYLYLIRDKDTGEVWFVGTVYEPTKK